MLLTKSVFHPVLKSFNASFHLEGHDKAFATIEVPDLMGKNGTEFMAGQTIQIADMNELTTYCLALFGGPGINVTLTGHGGLKLGGLQTTNVNYNQKIAVSGMSMSRATSTESLADIPIRS